MLIKSKIQALTFFFLFLINKAIAVKWQLLIKKLLLSEKINIIFNVFLNIEEMIVR
jgi:hypothetical protein